MFEKPIQFSLEKRLLVVTGAVLLIFLGVWAWITLRIEAYPDVSDTEVDIITQYDDRPAEEVEQQITIPIERAMNSVPKAVSQRSRTIYGLSIVKISFEEGTDDYFARQQVIEKLREADLPDGVTPTLGPLTTPVGEIFRYVIEGDEKYTQMDLRELQDWVVIPKILQANGIADIANFGGLVKRYNIIIHPRLLYKYNLTVQNVSDAIAANNGSTGGGIIQTGASQLSIRSIGRIRNMKDIERIVVTVQNGVPIFIRDLASVEIGYLTPTGIFGYVDKRRGVEQESGVQGIVLMRRGENAANVLQGIKEKINELNSGKLPPGVKVIPTYDRTDLISSTLLTVGRTLAEGITIVVVVLLFFLGNLRSAITVAIIIPLSLLFSFIAMRFTGIPANLLSLGAIDFGIIVDSAVIMVESITRHISLASEEEKKKSGIIRLIIIAAGEVERQIFFSVLIIILAYLPLFTLQRIEGKLFSPMAYTLSYAIFGGMLFSLTLVPVISSYLFTDKMKEWHNPIVAWIEKKYRLLIVHIIRNPLKPIAISVVSVILSLVVGFFAVGTEFLPELDEGGFDIRCVLPAGISLKEAKKYPPIIRQIIGKADEVKFVVTQLGRNDDGTDPYGPNRIETIVQLKPYGSWKSHKIKKDLLREFKKSLEEAIPGASFSFSQPILDNVTEAVTGSSSDLAVMVEGDDLNELRKIAEKIFSIVKKVRGASETGIEQEGNQTQLVIEIDREAAARYGINLKDIDTIVELAVAGKPFATVYEGERRFSIALRYTAQERSTPEAIGDLLISSASGAKIPLSQLATIKMVDGATIIARDAGHREVNVRTNIRERDQGGFVAEAQRLVNSSITLPDGYFINWGGQFENLSRAQHRLTIVIPLTVLMIFIMLFIFFKNGVHAAIVLTNVPFALVGGIFAIAIRGIHFSVSAGVGFISLFGVAVMSGVLLISYINYLRHEKLLDLETAVIQGSTVQLKPVMMMMIVALIGLIPAARASGIGSDIQRPLATVIVGGLTSALVLTLLVMPALYYVIEKWEEDKKLQNKMGLPARNPGFPGFLKRPAIDDLFLDNPKKIDKRKSKKKG